MCAARPSCVDVPKAPWLEVPRTAPFLVCPWGTPAPTVPSRRRLQQPRGDEGVPLEWRNPIIAIKVHRVTDQLNFFVVVEL